MKMQSKKTAILAIVMAFVLLSFVACSNRDEQNSVAPSTSNAPSSQSEPTPPPQSSQSDDELRQELMQERGLEEWQIDALIIQSFPLEDIAKLTDEEIAKALAPGSVFMGDYMEPEEQEKLIASGMAEDDVYVLNNLGYDYDSAIALTPEQLDFIFPNTELVDNLVALGYDKNIVRAAGSLSVEGGFDTYKVFLDEVFAIYLIGYGQDETPATDNNSAYQSLALDIIEKYKSNSITVNDDFPALPSDFVFPDDLSNIEIQQSEMGGFYAIITDKNGKYEMGISFDNSTSASGVMFNKIA